MLQVEVVRCGLSRGAPRIPRRTCPIVMPIHFRVDEGRAARLRGGHGSIFHHVSPVGGRERSFWSGEQGTLPLPRDEVLDHDDQLWWYERGLNDTGPRGSKRSLETTGFSQNILHSKVERA